MPYLICFHRHQHYIFNFESWGPLASKLTDLCLKDELTCSASRKTESTAFCHSERMAQNSAFWRLSVTQVPWAAGEAATCLGVIKVHKGSSSATASRVIKQPRVENTVPRGPSQYLQNLPDSLPPTPIPRLASTFLSQHLEVPACSASLEEYRSWVC